MVKVVRRTLMKQFDFMKHQQLRDVHLGKTVLDIVIKEDMVFLKIMLKLFIIIDYQLNKVRSRFSFFLFLMFFRLGHATAQNNLGYCYQYGQGVEMNYGEAVKWYKLSVEQGQASAENNLGFCYQCGIGVKKDLSEAVRLYKSSAEKGYAVAMYNLGLCYLNGMGIPSDPVKSVQLIKSSAEQGHTAGQVKLAMCYEEGIGVPNKDTREAIRWYVMAARRGDETAMKALKRIHG
jgi:TPR repeat protein